MTKTGNTVRVASRALTRNKLRSLLTALGIIIGVACAVVGIGEGARIQAENQLLALGTNFLMVMPGTKLSEDDVEAIRREVSSVSYISASIRTVGQVIYGNQNWSTSIQRAQVDWPLAVVEHRDVADLHGPGRPRRREGLRPRPDRRHEPVRRRGPDRQDDPHETSMMWAGTPRRSSSWRRWHSP